MLQWKHKQWLYNALWRKNSSVPMITLQRSEYIKEKQWWLKSRRGRSFKFNFTCMFRRAEWLIDFKLWFETGSDYKIILMVSLSLSHYLDYMDLTISVTRCVCSRNPIVQFKIYTESWSSERKVKTRATAWAAICVHTSRTCLYVCICFTKSVTRETEISKQITRSM